MAFLYLVALLKTLNVFRHAKGCKGKLSDIEWVVEGSAFPTGLHFLGGRNKVKIWQSFSFAVSVQGAVSKKAGRQLLKENSHKNHRNTHIFNFEHGMEGWYSEF